MNAILLTGLDAADPLAFLAAIGTLSVVSRDRPDARLGWEKDGAFMAVLSTAEPVDPVNVIMEDVARWRDGHAALDFAIGADRKVQDLKHEPSEFRALMRRLADEPESAGFIAAYATGVAVDGSGQTKPTSLHFTAGQQRFVDAILSLCDGVDRSDIEEALFGPWIGRVGPKDPRWRAASDRSRALLSFDPSKESARTIAGAAWLAFRAMPLFPVVPVGSRAVTTGFTGRGKNEQFTWPVWSVPLSLAAIRTLVGMAELDRLDGPARRARGIARIYTSTVVRSPQGYGNFSASTPVLFRSAGRTNSAARVQGRRAAAGEGR